MSQNLEILGPTRAKKLKLKIREGIVEVQRAQNLATQEEASSHIAEEMASRRAGATVKYWSVKIRKTQIEAGLLSKFASVCLSKAGGRLGPDWVASLFAANAMDRKDMTAELVSALEEIESAAKPLSVVKGGTGLSIISTEYVQRVTEWACQASGGWQGQRNIEARIYPFAPQSA
ncbi:MAG: hypothetical protein Kow0063_44850 [Anaerolineae bacterium]